MEVNLPFLLCFTLYLRAIFLVQAPGGLYLEGRFNGGFSRYRIGGLIFEGAYTWKGLFSEFYGILKKKKLHVTISLQNSEEFVRNQALMNLSRQVL